MEKYSYYQFSSNYQLCSFEVKEIGYSFAYCPRYYSFSSAALDEDMNSQCGLR
jgi:hypothetical protein